MTRGLLGLFALAWVLAAVVIVGAVPVLAVVGTLVLFALPGWAWALPTDRPPVSGLLVAGLCGLAVSSVLNAALVRLLGWHVVFTAALLLALAGAALGLRRRLPRAAVAPSAWSASDARFLLLVALLVLVFVAVPLVRNPSVDGDAHAYHSLMAHDYLMRGTFSVGVRQGLPPRDAFLASERMHNYCLYYALVAFAMETSGGTVAPERFVAATDLVLPFLFLLALFVVCRVFLSGRGAWVAVLLGVVAYSFNDLFVFTKYVRWSGIDRLHDLAAEYSDLSHGWTRDFLVEPHAVLALVFGFTALALSAGARRAQAGRHPSVAIGVLLAGAFAADGFLGTLFVVFFGLTYGIGWLRHRGAGDARRPGPGAWLGMGLPFAALAGVALGTGLASAGTPSGGLMLRPYATAVELGVVLFPLVLGPALLFALLVLGRGPRAVLRGWPTLFALAGLCLFAALFVQHSDPDFADLVLRKSLKVMRLPVVILAAVGLAWLLRSGLAARTLRWRRRVVWALVLLAVPTLLVDAVTLAGLHDRVRTSTVTQAEIDACAWLREHTPRDAVVQSLPENLDGYYRLSPVAMFGGRTMALGNRKMARLSSPSAAAFDAVAADVDHLFRSPDPGRAVRVMRERGIDYVLVGPREKEAYDIGTHKFAMFPDVFECVYAERGVAIFRAR